MRFGFCTLHYLHIKISIHFHLQLRCILPELVNMPNSKLYRRRVPVLSQAADDPNGLVAEIAVMPPGLTGVDIGKVKFEERDADAEKRIPDGYAGVSVTGGVDDDEVDSILASLVDPLDESALEVGLEGVDLDGAVGD